MSYKLSFDKPADSAAFQPRIGGEALLPAEVAWPTNPHSEPLVLVASLPSSLLNEHCDYALPDGSFVSVFTTYKKSDYFLDVITYFGSEEELSNIQQGYTKVLVHKAGPARSECEHGIPARQIELSDIASAEEVNYAGSKLAGEPEWLQQESITLPGYRYALQLYSADFPEGFEDIFYLTDAVGYLFLSSQLSLDTQESGLFFVQTT